MGKEYDTSRSPTRKLPDNFLTPDTLRKVKRQIDVSEMLGIDLQGSSG